MKRLNDGMDRPQKSPASQLYWNDLLAELTPLSDIARGLWMVMLCHMALSPQRGKLVYADGSPWSVKDIKKLSGSGNRSAESAYSELNRKAVFSVLSDGTHYNRRMARESELSKLRQVAGNKGVEARKQPVLVNQKSTMNETLVAQSADFGQPKAEQNLARASAPSSSSSLLTTTTTNGSKNGQPKTTTTTAGDLASRPSPRPEPERGEQEQGLEAALIPEIAELFEALGERVGMPGKPSAVSVKRTAKLIAECGRYADLAAVDAVLPDFLEARSKLQVPKSWRWFPTVVANAIAEGDL